MTEPKPIILSILIPTIVGREVPFNRLVDKFKFQIAENWLGEEVEIVSECDNREMSIGSKRQLLLERAQGKFVVFIDDDDDVPNHYCFAFVYAIRNNPDLHSIGFLQHCTFDGGSPSLASLSNRWHDWATDYEGYKFVRTPFFPTPILREIALQIGYRDLRYGEDYDFSKRLKESGLIKNEQFINEVLYFYQYTHAPFEQKYGVQKQ